MTPRRHVRPPDLPGDPEADRPLSLRSRLRLKVGADEDGLRLDHFLAKRCTWRSRTKIEELIQTDQVELEGRAPRPSRKVHAGETIVVKLPRPKREVDLRARGDLPDLPILFEDVSLVAVDKPAGIPVHPGGRLLEDTVITRLRERFAAAAKNGSGGVGDVGDVGEDGGAIVPKLCHRIDLETSGVLLVAKSDAVAAEMGRQMRRRETIKEYQALVHGVVKQDDFIIDAPLGDHPASLVRNRRAVVPGGSPSKTGVTVERRFAKFTLVRCRLFTGRRHQIRCHLHHAGFPIVGDKVYGLDEEFFLAYYEGRLDAEMLQRLRLPRQALHAARLAFAHPKTKQLLAIEAPLPADLTAFVATLDP